MNRHNSPRVELSSRASLALKAMAAAGVVTATVGTFLAPDRAWANWLLSSYYLLGLGLAGLCLVAIHYASGATWSVGIRRVPEAMAGTIPLAVAALALVFIVRPEIYPRSADFGLEPGASFAFKRAWLSWPFFAARAVAYVSIWMLFAMAIRRRSRRQDEDGDARWTRANVRLSAAFLVLFAVTFSLATFDWIMSLEPAWYSTIFAVYNFAGIIAAGLAATIIVAIWLERAGPLQGILTDDHLHDLGTLLFAFSTFWMYIWFSQYMLIWYTNIPEETAYYVRRLHGAWGWLFMSNVVLNWGVPFLILLRRNAKRHRMVVGGVSAVVLVGHWLDLYLMILPSIAGSVPPFGVWELGIAAGGLGLFGLALVRVLGGAPVVPLRDPQVSEGLQYQR